MTLTPKEIFKLCGEQCKDNLHVFWWEFTEPELLEFVERIETLVLLKKELNEA